MPVAFSGKEFIFHDPDGSEIRVRGWGNQYRAVFETLDGFTVIKHPETGYFHIAALSEDATRLVPTDERVATVDTGALSAPKHIRPIRQAARQEARRTRNEPGQRRWETRREQRRARRRDALESDAEAEPEPPEPGTVGDYVGLCLLIRFPDVPDTVSRTEVERYCNQPGYSNFGNNGSVYDYFLDNSGGALRYTNVVTAYYTSKKNRDYYIDPTVEYGNRATELVVEALDDLRRQGFNFTQLSADDEGYIYAFNALYAGDLVNEWGEGLWPHAGWLDDYDVPGGLKHRDYQMTNIGDELLLATFCHENGHMICDFPDLYDLGDDGTYSSGVGHYCLMSGMGPEESDPIQICAYLKNQAGWTASLTTIRPGMHATITSTSNDFYIHKLSTTEYFIIENRQKAGRDKGLPDAGLAIWHVDELGKNENQQMTKDLHYECSLEQADNKFDLERNVNLGDGGDLFGTPSATTFGARTHPDSKWWNGRASGLELTQISTPGPTMTFKTR